MIIRNSHQIRKLPYIMRRTLIPPRIPIQIKLMILLCIPPLPGLEHLSRHFALIPLLIHFPRHLLRLRLLLRRMPENRTAILTPCIHALPIFRSGIMHAVEERQEGSIADFLRVEDDLEGFSVAGPSAADGAVRGAVGVAADVAYFGVDEALVREVLAEEVLHAPEAAGCDGAFLAVFWDAGRGGTGGAGVEGHGGGGCEGAEEAVEEGRHRGGHD